MLCTVFPKVALSQTITSYDDAKITNPSEVYSQPDPNKIARAYKSWQLTEEANKLKGKYGGPCVTFARNFTKATTQNVSGVAKNVNTNTTTPEVGVIVKTNESKYGHLAVVISIEEDNLTVVESNYHWDNIVDVRQIPINDPRILGYLKIN